MTASEQVAFCLGRRRRIRCRGEATAALDGMATRGFAEVAQECIESRLMRRRQGVGVKPLDRLVTGVVLGAEEVRAFGNEDAACSHPAANLRTIGHRRKHARIRPAMTPGAGSTIIGRQMRIVGTVRTMADDHHQRREVFRQPDAAQETGDPLDLLAFGKTFAWHVRGHRC